MGYSELSAVFFGCLGWIRYLCNQNRNTLMSMKTDMRVQLIGRRGECRQLDRVMASGTSEFVVVYGRRRVGKTFLVNQYFSHDFTFKYTGLALKDKSAQLLAFHQALNEQGHVSYPQPRNWMEAFSALRNLIDNARCKRKVVFIDELPFMDTPRGGLIPALEHFWNDWASVRTDVVLIVCGSATSWITRKILQSHGGLHNRLTARIRLHPFSLAECREYLQQKNMGYDDRTIAECYMVMGGIPYYLSLLQRGLSLAQNVDRLLFSRDGDLADEYSQLFASLFAHPDGYMKVVEALSMKNKGLTKAEIVEATGLPNSGALTDILRDLESCDFIRSYRGYGNTERMTIYQLMDFYTLFYHQFVKKYGRSDKPVWMHLMSTPRHHSWSGYAFEQLCLYHHRQIEQKLGISGIMTETFGWSSAPNKHPGTQIDLVIRRADRMVNVCEMKYSDGPFVLTRQYEEKLRECIQLFRQENHIRGAVNLVMVTTYGVADAASHSIVWSEVTLPDLFASPE